MSSPAPSLQSLQSGSTRNPRRRQRHDSEEGASLRQQPQRKRSKLNRDVFKPAEAALANGDVATTTKMNWHVSPGRSERSSSVQPMDMPHRGKQHSAAGKRGTRDDGTTTLTKNANYIVKQLPSLPTQIRSSKQGSFRGARIHSNGYALGLTRDQALVWDYTTPKTAPTTRAFSLPHHAKTDDPLPLGAFVTAGSASETGLVVINATSGNISFWENIENADALSLFEQRRNGIEGSCGSLMSGETVTDIEGADSAGFVLSFSSGRTAQLLVRDAQSRPAISVNFLRANKGTTSGGFLSGLRSVFSGAGTLRSVAAVRTRSSPSRGLADVVISTEDGLLQFWQLSWSGQATLQREVDAREALDGVVPTSGPESSAQARVADFAITSDSEEECDFLVLVNFISAGSSTYALVELETDNSAAAARRTIVLHSYSAPFVPLSSWKPRLCIPNPGHTAFVVFEKALVVVSLRAITASPNSQFLIDTGQLPEPFQDTVYFRDGSDCFVCGAASENGNEKNQSPSAIVFVRSFGLLRITASDPAPDAETSDRSNISAKSKIEQAVYFGTLTSNPLNLSHRSEITYPIEEVEQAALDISREIAATDSPFIVAVAPSMEYHLEQRARLLKDLALHLKQLYPGISRVTKWNLRFEAEKMAAARKVWSLYDALVRERPKDQLLLTELLLAIHESNKTVLDPKHGGNDRVRQWFLKDVWRMETLISWAYETLRLMQDEGMIKGNDKYLDLLSEADDYVIGGLQAAFAFRTDNAELYGLENERVKGGLLTAGYEDLPEIWASDPSILMKMSEHIENARITILENTTEIEILEEASDIVRKIVSDYSRLIDLYCLCSEENWRWYSIQTDEKERTKTDSFLELYYGDRKPMITSLVEISMELAGTAMDLAEKYGDMQALVELISIQARYLAVRSLSKDSEVAREGRASSALLDKKLKGFFKKYGDAWANAMFSNQTGDSKFHSFLEQSKDYKAEITRYLRADPARSRLSWINDVLSERDYASAAQALMTTAGSQETGLWSKKVELSIAKLSLLVVDGDDNRNEQLRVAKAAQNDEWQLVKIQEKLTEHIRPSFYGAIDKDAELQLAMERFSRRLAKGSLASQQLLTRGFESIVKCLAMDPEQIIDVLTLMDQRQCEVKQNDISGREPFYALQILKHAGFGKEKQRFELLLKVIWRRCFIKDGWKALNDTARKSDSDAMADIESTTLYKTLYEGYATELWEGPSGVRVLAPRDVLGAGTTPDEHRDRFQSAELREPISRDMAQEDAVLQYCMDHYQLEHWVTATKDLAERRVGEEAERKEEMAKKLGPALLDVYGESADLKRAGERAGLSMPRSWREAVQMGLGAFGF